MLQTQQCFRRSHRQDQIHLRPSCPTYPGQGIISWNNIEVLKSLTTRSQLDLTEHAPWTELTVPPNVAHYWTHPCQDCFILKDQAIWYFPFIYLRSLVLNSNVIIIFPSSSLHPNTSHILHHWHHSIIYNPPNNIIPSWRQFTHVFWKLLPKQTFRITYMLYNNIVTIQAW